MTKNCTFADVFCFDLILLEKNRRLGNERMGQNCAQAYHLRLLLLIFLLYKFEFTFQILVISVSICAMHAYRVTRKARFVR